MAAASLLPSEYREKIKIIIAGNQRKDLDDTDYQAIMDGLGVQDVVEFLPQRVPDEQVPDYFNRADCCLFPYKEIYGSGALLNTAAITVGVGSTHVFPRPNHLNSSSRM